MRAKKIGGEIRITESYLYRESIKEIAGRRYDPEDRAWYIPLTDKNIGLLQLLGADMDDKLKGFIKSNATQDSNSSLVVGMPIRAAPYAHQIEAFNFAMRIYGITSDKDAKEVVQYDIQQGT